MSNINKKLLKIALVYRQRYLNCKAQEFIPAPKISFFASHEEVQNILRMAVDAKLFLSDEKYGLCSIKEIQKFLDVDSTNKQHYRHILYDCDDFSYRLIGALSVPGWSALAVGIAWSDVHAFNLFIDDRKQLYIIEPQEDKIIPFSQSSWVYKPRVIMI